MKQFFSITILTIFCASCTVEPEPLSAEWSKVSLSLSIPSDTPLTRSLAVSDRAASDKGGLSNNGARFRQIPAYGMAAGWKASSDINEEGTVLAHRLRILAEFWTKEPTPRLARRLCTLIDGNATAAKEIVLPTTTIKKGAYTLYCHADFVAVNTPAFHTPPNDFDQDTIGVWMDLYYDSSNGLPMITRKIPGNYFNNNPDETNDTRGGNLDALDHYAYKGEVGIEDNTLIKQLTLTRPVGKIRLISQEEGEGGVEINYVRVTYTAGEQGTYTAQTYGDKSDVNGYTQQTLLWDYLTPGTISLSFDIDTSTSFYTGFQGSLSSVKRVENIPVEANRLTTIIVKGLLTSKTEVYSVSQELR